MLKELQTKLTRPCEALYLWCLRPLNPSRRRTLLELRRAHSRISVKQPRRCALHIVVRNLGQYLNLLLLPEAYGRSLGMTKARAAKEA